jgi:hypothetical protein
MIVLCLPVLSTNRNPGGPDGFVSLLFHIGFDGTVQSTKMMLKQSIQSILV